MSYSDAIHDTLCLMGSGIPPVWQPPGQLGGGGGESHDKLYYLKNADTHTHTHTLYMIMLTDNYDNNHYFYT